MIVNAETLAEIDGDGPWATLALALATGATPRVVQGWPPTVVALAAAKWSLHVEDDDGEARRWDSSGLDPVVDHVAELIRAHGVTATQLRYFADDDPRILVAAWSPGDADAVLHEVRIYGGGREIYVHPHRAAGIEPWLREVLDSMFREGPGQRVESPLRRALDDVLRTAAAVRRELLDRCTAHAEAMQRRADRATGAADDAILRAWEEAEHELARVRAMPAIFRGIDPA